jgi:hypothetical protein
MADFDMLLLLVAFCCAMQSFIFCARVLFPESEPFALLALLAVSQASYAIGEQEIACRYPAVGAKRWSLASGLGFGAASASALKLGHPRRLGARRGRLVLRIGLGPAGLLCVGWERQAFLERDLMVSVGIRHGDVETAGGARDCGVPRVGAGLLGRVLEILARLGPGLVDFLLRIRLRLRHVLLGDDGGLRVVTPGEKTRAEKDSCHEDDDGLLLSHIALLIDDAGRTLGTAGRAHKLFSAVVRVGRFLQGTSLFIHVNV